MEMRCSTITNIEYRQPMELLVPKSFNNYPVKSNFVKKSKKTNLISKAKPLFFSTNLIIGTRAFAITYSEINKS